MYNRTANYFQKWSQATLILTDYPPKNIQAATGVNQLEISNYISLEYFVLSSF